MAESSTNLVIGRSRDCDLTLKDPTVSGRHARLTWQEGKILVEDLGSANGTFVGGRRVERALIRPGDDVRLGRASLPWSASALRPFLRVGGKDTILGESIPGSRFICGACGTRGMMPAGFKGGVLRCGACGQRLIVSQPGRRWPGAVMSIAAIAVLAAGVTWAVRGGSESPLSRAASLVSEQRQAVQASSPQEASIRVHTLAKVVEAIDSSHPVTRNEAVRLAALDQGSFRVEQVARIWSHVRSQWRYVNDPRGDEYFATASETIGNGYIGDCDDFAIVLVAMIQAIGGDARIVMMDGPQGGHAYAEVCLPDSSDDVRDRLAAHYRRNRDPSLGNQTIRTIHFRPGHDCMLWLNLDWNAGVPGGPYEPERWAVAIYSDGRTETLAPAGSLDESMASANGTGASNGAPSTSGMVAAPP
ncbi:MAG: FHA domain-containing protein [Myxococcales bacterium]|nr:FHA domain-containing protein [Myxococcales bacterium]